MEISAQSAFRILRTHVRRSKKISVGLDNALGCCLCTPVRADRDHPPTDRSAMDGFAVRTDSPESVLQSLPLVGEVAAGSDSCPRVRPGTCVRVLTGAVVPLGANAVVRLEDTAVADGAVTFLEPVRSGANIRKRGEETRRGDIVIPAGSVLGSAEFGVCAAMGKAEVRVHRPPSVAVLSTGRELKRAEQRVRPQELRDSNGPTLQAALTHAGFGPAPHRIVTDDPHKIQAALQRAVDHYDVVVTTGGVSVGRYDYVPAAVRAIGAKVRFHGVRMKPGKPQLYATLPGNRHIFGLPGNPLSALVGLHELVLPALRLMAGWPVRRCRPATFLPLARSARRKGNRTEYRLARLVRRKSGSRLESVKVQGSADLVAAVAADGVFILPKEVTELPAGACVEFRPWRDVV